jgi:hypothetical protein
MIKKQKKKSCMKGPKTCIFSLKNLKKTLKLMLYDALDVLAD